jgi:hypothetical protein
LRNNEKKSEGDDALKAEIRNKREIKSGTDLNLRLAIKHFMSLHRQSVALIVTSDVINHSSVYAIKCVIWRLVN